MNNTIFTICITAYLATCSALAWALDASYTVFGLLVGAVVALLPLAGILKPNNHDIVKLNLLGGNAVMLITVVVAFAHLYSFASVGEVFLPAHMFTLLFAVAACACLQLLHLAHTKAHSTALSMVQTIFAGPALVLPLCLAMFVTSTIMLVLVLTADVAVLSTLKIKLVDRGIIPPIIVVLFVWGLYLFAAKWLQLRGEWRLVASKNIDQSQLLQALTHMHNTAKHESTTTDVSSEFMDLCWQKAQYFLTIPRYINWAMPILGFIGTVLGISLAAESIGNIIASSQTSLSAGLAEAITPLGIAFDTTLIALTLSVVLMLLQTLFQRWLDKHLLATEHTIQSLSPIDGNLQKP